jgi:hypothetical protein
MAQQATSQARAGVVIKIGAREKSLQECELKSRKSREGDPERRAGPFAAAPRKCF